MFIGGTQTGGIVANCDFGNVVVSNCRNYGNVQSTNTSVGGIVGGMFQTNEGNSATITNCQNNGEIGKYVNDSNIGEIGGIVGRTIGGSIDNCVNNGQVNGYSLVGGISGRNSQTPIESCRNYGKVAVYNNRGGGIAGLNESATINKSFNDGMVYLGEDGYFGIGGIVAAIAVDSSNYIIDNNYWLNTCGATYGYNRGQSNDGAESRNTSELQRLASVLGESYKDDEKGINEGYPILSWQ